MLITISFLILLQLKSGQQFNLIFFESNQTDSLKKEDQYFFECAVMVLHCCMDGYDVGDAELANILTNVYIYFIIYHSDCSLFYLLFFKFIL